MNSIVLNLDDMALQTEMDVIDHLCEYYIKECQCMMYTGETHVFQEGDKMDAFKSDIKQAVQGNDDEHPVKRVLLIIPRILKALVRAIGRIITGYGDTIKEMKALQKRVAQLEKRESQHNESIKKMAEYIIQLKQELNEYEDLNAGDHDKQKDLMLKIFNCMKQVNLSKVDRSDNLSQIRAVLTLSGYVLYTFDIRVYMKYLEEVDGILSKLENLDMNKKDVNFSEFSASNLGMEIDQGKYQGQFIYRINEFESFIHKYHKTFDQVRKRCDVLIHKFEKAMKTSTKNDDITFGNNATNAAKSSRKIMTRIMNVNKMLLEDERHIRSLIRSEMDAITHLISPGKGKDGHPPVDPERDRDFLELVHLLSQIYDNTDNYLNS